MMIFSRQQLFVPHHSLRQSWKWARSIHGSGRVGSDWITKFSVLGGSGWVRSSVIKSNKYTIYTQETDYWTTISIIFSFTF